VGDLTRHEKLQRVNGARVVAKVDQALIDDFGARLRGDITAKVDIQLAGDFEIVGRPCIAHGILKGDAASPGDCDQGIYFGSLAVVLHRFEMHPRQGADDLKMAQLFCADVHQHVFPFGVVTIEALNRILHGSGEFAVGAAKLLQQHVAESRIRCTDLYGVHQLLNMVIHSVP